LLVNLAVAAVRDCCPARLKRAVRASHPVANATDKAGNRGVNRGPTDGSMTAACGVAAAEAAVGARTAGRACFPADRLRPIAAVWHCGKRCPSQYGEDVMKRLLLAIVLSCACPALVTTADARSSYDGTWNLTFFTQRGACDQTYNFLVNINNGVVTSPAFPKFRGFVASSGAVRASVTVRDKYASGSGRLAGNAGRGSWTGHSGRERCAGSWAAQRSR
jgi:hypothetical protein